MTRTSLTLALALPIAFGPACARAGEPPSLPATAAPYAAMAPVAQYGIANPEDEIVLARSAAPPSISADADVLVLGSRGYETAAKGKNGFVCIVERSWAAGFDDPEFWNPKLRSPNCFNAPAVRTVLSQYLRVTEWVLAGVSKDEMIVRTRAALASHAFTPPEPGSMCFMMSGQGYLSDRDGHWMPHLMFFVPRTAASFWGANLPGSPVIAHEGNELDPSTIFFVPVRKWSDGSPAPDHHAK
jgi:hypothetical protein